MYSQAKGKLSSIEHGQRSIYETGVDFYILWYVDIPIARTSLILASPPNFLYSVDIETSSTNAENS